MPVVSLLRRLARRRSRATRCRRRARPLARVGQRRCARISRSSRDGAVLSTWDDDPWAAPRLLGLAAAGIDGGARRARSARSSSPASTSAAPSTGSWRGRFAAVARRRAPCSAEVDDAEYEQEDQRQNRRDQQRAGAAEPVREEDEHSARLPAAQRAKRGGRSSGHADRLRRGGCGRRVASAAAGDAAAPSSWVSRWAK